MGAEDYFKKPVNLESFQHAVKRASDRKTVFDENTGATHYLNLLNSCQLISAAMDQSKVFAVVQSYFWRELHAQHSAFYRIEEGRAMRLLEVEGSENSDRAMEEVLDITLAAANPLEKMAESSEFYRFVERGHLTPGLFVFRFRCVGASDLFFVCLSPERPTPMDAFESRVRLLKAQIEVSGKNIEQYMGVQSLAYVDDATGLYNTRYLSTILDREILQNEQTGQSFAVLFIDVDKFKSVNDTHGHLIGTKLLNALGAQLKKYVRGSDTVFRYGGDEFVAVLSPADLQTAQMVAERIRQSVEASVFLREEGVDVRFTVSIGVALYPDHAQSKKTVIEAADQAMYSAKKTSRNCVYLASHLMKGAAAPEALPTKIEKPGKASQKVSGKGQRKASR